MARTYAATLQVRTSLDQAGHVAGIAGELETTESEVVRLLLARALAEDPLNYIRGELAEQRERQREAEAEADLEITTVARLG